MSDLSWLNPTPHAIAVYASRPLSPVATQHSLPSGRYPLLGPDFHRLDRTSLRLAHSLDHLIGDQQDVTINCQPHFSRSLQVDDKLELGWPFDGQVRRLRPFEYLVHIRSGTPEQIVKVRSVGHQTSGVHELPRLIHPWQSVVRREFHDAPVLAEQHR